MYLPDTSENSEAGSPALVKKLSLSFMYTVLSASMMSAVPDTALLVDVALADRPMVPWQPCAATSVRSSAMFCPELTTLPVIRTLDAAFRSATDFWTI